MTMGMKQIETFLI